MPTVLRFAGLRVVIWPNDHPPAHVHVVGAGVEAVFVLNCPGGPVMLRDSLGFRLAEIRSVAERLTLELAALCATWKAIHGDD